MNILYSFYNNFFLKKGKIFPLVINEEDDDKINCERS